MVLATDFDPNFSSDFGIVIQDEQTLTIKHGVSNSSFVNADTSIKLKSLHMKKGSVLIIDYSAGYTRIEALEATFDEGSSIIVEGKDGHKVGEDGYPILKEGKKLTQNQAETLVTIIENCTLFEKPSASVATTVSV